MVEQIIEMYGPTDGVVLADGLDDAVIGFEPNMWKVVYSRNKVIDILMNRDEMDGEEALEFAEYNIFSAYYGDKTPIWVEDFNWKL